MEDWSSQLKEREIWKDIKGFEGRYQISNLGRVKSLYAYGWEGKEIIIKPCKTHKGYLKVWLKKDGNKRMFFVHRLVAIHFIDNPNNLPQVNHKDENKENNSVDNLEWCTNEYNHNYGTHNNRVSEKLKKPIIGINIKTGLILEFDSIKEAMECLGKGKRGAISQVCKGKQGYKSAYGYRWMYKEDK